MGNFLERYKNNIPAHIRNHVKEPTEATRALLAGLESREVPTISRKNSGRIVIKIPGRDPITSLKNGEPLRRIQVIMVTANPDMPRAWYASNEMEDGMPPDCASLDGKYPRKGVKNKQSLTCALCKRAIWKDGDPPECKTQKHLVVRMPQSSMLFFMKLTPADLDKKLPDAYHKVTTSLKEQGIAIEDVVFTLSLRESSKGSRDFVQWAFEPTEFVTPEMQQEIREAQQGTEWKSVLGLDIFESDIPSEAEEEQAAKPSVVKPPPRKEESPEDLFGADADASDEVIDLVADETAQDDDFMAGIYDVVPDDAPKKDYKEPSKSAARDVNEIMADFADLDL